MPCHNQGCPGEYEQQSVVRVFEHRGRPVVIERIPASVCSVCGDTLFSWQTSRQLEALLADLPTPARSVPLYEFPHQAPAAAQTRSGEVAAGRGIAGGRGGAHD